MNKFLTLIILTCALPLHCARAQQEAPSAVAAQKSEDSGHVATLASVKLNPFLSLDEEKRYSEPKKPVFVMLSNYNLSAIFRSQVHSEDKAIINGMICKVDDIIDSADGKKIVEIQPQAVILRDIKDVEYILTLYK